MRIVRTPYSSMQPDTPSLSLGRVESIRSKYVRACAGPKLLYVTYVRKYEGYEDVEGYARKLVLGMLSQLLVMRG